MAKNKNGRHLENYKGDLYHRHYCKECGTRVYPYDSLESLTVAPHLGASKHEILLYSYNSYRRDKQGDISRTAYCWQQGKWVETYRESRFETQLRYLKRNGIKFRFPNGKIEEEPAERTFIRALDARIEERRPVTLKRR